MPIDTEYQMYITCPHCGYKDLDSWDHGLDRDGETLDDFTCDKCEKEFNVEFHLEVSYSTTKLEESSTEKEKP